MIIAICSSSRWSGAPFDVSDYYLLREGGKGDWEKGHKLFFRKIYMSIK